MQILSGEVAQYSPSLCRALSLSSSTEKGEERKQEHLIPIYPSHEYVSVYACAQVHLLIPLNHGLSLNLELG